MISITSEGHKDERCIPSNRARKEQPSKTNICKYVENLNVIISNLLLAQSIIEAVN